MCVVTRFRLMTASIVSDLSLKMVDIACSQFFMTRAIMLALKIKILLLFFWKRLECFHLFKICHKLRVCSDI